MEHISDRMCILFVTHQCNLNCVYCYEKFKSKQRMSLATAQGILTEEILSFQSRGSGGTLTIDFMGGEPLLNFELIRDVCEWLWTTHPDAPCKLALRTNGTCFTTESMDWFARNKERIHVGLSLDGITELQDLNRSGSSSRIPLDFFLENWPHMPIKATIAPQGLSLLATSAIYFHERNIPFSLTIAQGVEWGEAAPELFREQLLTLLDYYHQHPELKPEASLFVEDFRMLSLHPEHPFPMCGSQEEMVAYTAEGKRSICHLFAEPAMGPELAETYRNKTDFPEILPPDPSCTLCPARPICKICPGFNAVASGSLHIQDKRVCGMMRALVAVNCVRFIKQMEQHTLENTLDAEGAQQLSWALEHADLK